MVTIFTKILYSGLFLMNTALFILITTRVVELEGMFGKWFTAWYYSVLAIYVTQSFLFFLS